MNTLKIAILDQTTRIESWFQNQWQSHSPPITSSIDLRASGYKIAPVDTNLFPAGFNNLSEEFIPLCVDALRSVLKNNGDMYENILILPENHTRNPYYLESLAVLQHFLSQAGFFVRIGSLDPSAPSLSVHETFSGKKLTIEALVKEDDCITLNNFRPCVLLLNNDLSAGMPDILKGVKQPIQPTAALGWFSRQKSTHFNFYNTVADEFAELIQIDPWLLKSLFSTVEGVDFMKQTGLESLAQAVDQLFSQIRSKYAVLGIEDEPYVVIKADNGTYGMGILMVHSGQEVLQLNRKQRTRMSATKGGAKITRVLIQEGIYSEKKTNKGDTAEPVIYLIGKYVVGGFYRAHHSRGADENLNSPGMQFEPMSLRTPSNRSDQTLDSVDRDDSFYVYGVIARLSALAAAKEIAASKIC